MAIAQTLVVVVTSNRGGPSRTYTWHTRLICAGEESLVTVIGEGSIELSVDQLDKLLNDRKHSFTITSPHPQGGTITKTYRLLERSPL